MGPTPLFRRFGRYGRGVSIQKRDESEHTK